MQHTKFTDTTTHSLCVVTHVHHLMNGEWLPLMTVSSRCWHQWQAATCAWTLFGACIALGRSTAPETVFSRPYIIWAPIQNFSFVNAILTKFTNCLVSKRSPRWRLASSVSPLWLGPQQKLYRFLTSVWICMHKDKLVLPYFLSSRSFEQWLRHRVSDKMFAILWTTFLDRFW